jgi:hypothetical protein
MRFENKKTLVAKENGQIINHLNYLLESRSPWNEAPAEIAAFRSFTAVFLNQEGSTLTVSDYAKFANNGEFLNRGAILIEDNAVFVNSDEFDLVPGKVCSGSNLPTWWLPTESTESSTCEENKKVAYFLNTKSVVVRAGGQNASLTKDLELDSDSPGFFNNGFLDNHHSFVNEGTFKNTKDLFNNQSFTNGANPGSQKRGFFLNAETGMFYNSPHSTLSNDGTFAQLGKDDQAVHSSDAVFDDTWYNASKRLCSDLETCEETSAGLHNDGNIVNNWVFVNKGTFNNRNSVFTGNKDRNAVLVNDEVLQNFDGGRIINDGSMINRKTLNNRNNAFIETSNFFFNFKSEGEQEGVLDGVLNNHHSATVRNTDKKRV